VLDKRKSEAEQPEREAKERHEKAWEGDWIILFVNLSYVICYLLSSQVCDIAFSPLTLLVGCQEEHPV